MIDLHACPSETQLSTWACGDLSSQDSETVEMHVANCDTCQQFLLQSEEDAPMIQMLRKFATESRESEPAELLAVMKNAKGLSSQWRCQLHDRKDGDSDDYEFEVDGGMDSPTDDQPSQLGRYSIFGTIGAGGMGTVLKARDPELDRVVAIKVMKGASNTNSAARQRFLREARAAAAVHHPNVCPIYDVGEHDGIPYVVMAIVDGESLADRIRRSGRFESLEEAVQIAKQIADAMVAVHAHGIVHRDLKPANILIDRAGDAIVTDFGLALIDNEARITAAGSVWGTPAYMAPEQAAGKDELVGPCSDIYAIGAILFDILTGRAPYQGSMMQVLSSKANEDPRPPSQLRPEIDEPLERMVLTALARKPEDRYQSATELSEAFADWLAGHSAQTAQGKAASASSVGQPQIAPSTPTNSSPAGGRRRLAGAVMVLGVLFAAMAALVVPQVRKLVIRDQQGNKKAELTIDEHDTIEVVENDKSVTRIPADQGVGPVEPGTTSRSDARPVVAIHSRVTTDLAALYLFQDGQGVVIRDSADIADPLHLEIAEGEGSNWIPGSGLALDSSTVAASTSSADRLIAACQATNELTIEVWIRPQVADHTGPSPARIVSLSSGPLAQNFVLGQTGVDLRARVRTSETNQLGLPETSVPWTTLTPGAAHCVVTYDQAAGIRIYLDGVLREQRPLKGDFSTWATDQHLHIGNEHSKDRPWLGEFYLVAIYSRALSEEEVLQNYLATSTAAKRRRTSVPTR